MATEKVKVCLKYEKKNPVCNAVFQILSYIIILSSALKTKNPEKQYKTGKIKLSIFLYE